MALYKHVVFFQARELTDSEKKKIEKYFKIKRRSGGGECGPVEKTTDNTYMISFLEQEGQNRHCFVSMTEKREILNVKEDSTDVEANILTCFTL